MGPLTHVACEKKTSLRIGKRKIPLGPNRSVSPGACSGLQFQWIFILQASLRACMKAVFLRENLRETIVYPKSSSHFEMFIFEAPSCLFFFALLYSQCVLSAHLPHGSLRDRSLRSEPHIQHEPRYLIPSIPTVIH